MLLMKIYKSCVQIDSARWLDWLKGLRETHGSVEQSSLSLASAINTGGMYIVGWPEDFNGKVSRHKYKNVQCLKYKCSVA